MRVFTFVFVFALFLIPKANSKTQEQSFAWGSLKASWDINNAWSGFLSTEWRYHLDQKSPDQSLHFVGAKKKMDESTSVELMYGYVTTQNFIAHRFVGRFGKKLSSGWSNDTTLELRVPQGNLENSARLRYKLEYSKDWYVINNELFFNVIAQEWVGNYLFDQNRLFLGYQSNAGTIEYLIGYMNQFVYRGELNTMNHVVKLAVKF